METVTLSLYKTLKVNLHYTDVYSYTADGTCTKHAHIGNKCAFVYLPSLPQVSSVTCWEVSLGRCNLSPSKTDLRASPVTSEPCKITKISIIAEDMCNLCMLYLKCG